MKRGVEKLGQESRMTTSAFDRRQDDATQAHQFAALDFLLRGRLTQGLIHLIKAPTD